MNILENKVASQPENAPLTPLAGALQMAALGFPVFPLKPGTKDGMLVKSWKAWATVNPALIRAAAAEHPGCNWGARCSGHLVLDVDVVGEKRGDVDLFALDVEHELPTTRQHRSARGGLHLLFKLPEGVQVGNRQPEGCTAIDVRGDGGFIVCPGSTFEGRPYSVAVDAPVAMAPASLVAALNAAGTCATAPPPSPADVDAAVVRSALLHLPSGIPRQQWVEIGAALHHGFGGSDEGLALFNEWSARGENYADFDDVKGRWDSFKPDRQGPVKTLATIFDAAQRAGWQPPPGFTRPDRPSVNAMFDDAAELAAELTPAALGSRLVWPVMSKGEEPKPVPDERNVVAFLEHHGVSLWRDDFDGSDHIRGLGFDGRVNDDVVRELKFGVKRKGLRYPDDAWREALKHLAYRHHRHPVREWLAGLQWDGVPRVGSWLSRYLGAEDTPLLRAYGRLWLVAACRRVRQPGCKFDGMLVLEGAQGAGKSTALKILAGKWFEESLQLSAEPKVVIEQTRGKWIIEIAELSGMANREAEHVKALITRTDDRARLAYAKEADDVSRQFVLAATTNDTRYLRDSTGNRRFWPVKVGAVDLEGLRADREQLFAEAAAIEAEGGPLSLPADLWAASAEAQAERAAPDAIFETLQAAFGGRLGFVSLQEMYEALGARDAKSAAHGGLDKRAVAAMGRLGFERKALKENGKTIHGLSNWPGKANETPRLTAGQPAGLALVVDNDAPQAAFDILA